MKKLMSIITSLLVCALAISSIPEVYANETNTAALLEETFPQETVPTEDEVLPAFCDPQPDEVND